MKSVQEYSPTPTQVPNDIQGKAFPIFENLSVENLSSKPTQPLETRSKIFKKAISRASKC
jgi:hypothetical protein